MNQIELLEAAGFTPSGEGMSLDYFIETEVGHIDVVDAQTLVAPTDETKNFLALFPYGGDDPQSKYAIALETSDVRDVIAFGLAACNDVRFGRFGEPVESDQMFEFEDTAVHNAFADLQYGVWIGAQEVGWPTTNYASTLKVRHPSEHEWAAAYLEWRDRYCQTLATPKPPTSAA